MNSTIKYKRYPLNLTKFKTDNYKPKNHFRIPLRWDNFTMHVPLWKQVLSHYFSDRQNLKFLELGSGNGLCANFLLDNYHCHIDTVDIHDSHVWDQEEEKYIVSTSANLQPYIEGGRCNFHQMTTKEFLLQNQNKKYDFIYIDASHDKDWVLFDAVNSFSILEDNGLMIFDDYGWGDCKIAIDNFLECYDKHVEIFHRGWQVMVHKIDSVESEYKKQ
mgnify:CR=1 FL=1